MTRYTAYATLSWAETLNQILHGWHFDGGPGQPGPVLSRELAQILAGSTIVAMAGHIHDPRHAQEVRRLGQDLVRRGGQEIASGDGGGPPWADMPFPFPWPPKKFDPKASVFERLNPGALDQVLTGVAHRLAESVAQAPRVAAGGG